MSKFDCYEHGWRHVQTPCPKCPMSTSRDLDKLRDELAEKNARDSHWDYKNGFDACRSALQSQAVEFDEKLIAHYQFDQCKAQVEAMKAELASEKEDADRWNNQAVELVNQLAAKDAEIERLKQKLDVAREALEKVRTQTVDWSDAADVAIEALAKLGELEKAEDT